MLDCFLGDYTTLINTPDDELSDSSSNAVQNKVIYEGFEDIDNRLKEIQESLNDIVTNIESIEKRVDMIGYPYGEE
jgi:hypothetical protein